MAYNWQKWKRVFLTCPCHKIYRVEAVGLKSSNYTWKIMISANMWNLGQFREKMIFVTHHIKTGQLSVECISRYYSICMGKNKENKKKFRPVLGDKIAMLHPIYTWVVSSLS